MYMLDAGLVLVVDEDPTRDLTEPIAERGFDVVTSPSFSELKDHDLEGVSCVVCAQSSTRPVTTLIEALSGEHRPVVFVYNHQAAAARARDAGAAATVPLDGTGDGWANHLGATVEGIVRHHTRPGDQLVSPALDELPDILFVTTISGRLLRWNDRLTEVTGYSDEEIADMQPLELFDHLDIDRIEQTIGKIVMNGHAMVVADIQTREGDAIPHEFTGSLIEVDGTQAIVGTARDISDRLAREQALAEQAERLEAVNHVNALIRDVMGVLLAAETREELIANVCDRLTGPNGYRLAWIGGYDSASGRVEPEVWSGEGASYLKERPTGEGSEDTVTALTAIRERAVVFAQDVSSDAAATGWRAAALEHGHRAAAAIPLTYDSVAYGCLCLYADRPDAFGPLEREVLAELGDIIGHAIHATEAQRALITDTVTELQFRLTDEDSFLVQAAEDVDANLSLVGAVGRPDGAIIQLYEVSGIDPETVQHFVELTPTDAEIVTRHEGDCVVKVTITEYSIAHVLAEAGGSIRSIEVVDGEVRISAHIPTTVDAGEVLDRIGHLFDIEFLSRREVERPAHTDTEFRASVERRLTQRQFDVLETAFNAGFFEQPRMKSGEDIAELLEISAPTFHQHLRIGERKLLEVLFEHRTPERGDIDWAAFDMDVFHEVALEFGEVSESDQTESE